MWGGAGPDTRGVTNLLGDIMPNLDTFHASSRITLRPLTRQTERAASTRPETPNQDDVFSNTFALPGDASLRTAGPRLLQQLAMGVVPLSTFIFPEVPNAVVLRGRAEILAQQSARLAQGPSSMMAVFGYSNPEPVGAHDADVSPAGASAYCSTNFAIFDALKQQSLRNLEFVYHPDYAARRLDREVEIMHGRDGQSLRTHAVAKRLMEVIDLKADTISASFHLASERERASRTPAAARLPVISKPTGSIETYLAVLAAVPYLHLGDAGESTGTKLAESRAYRSSSDIDVGRFERTVQVVEKFHIADAHTKDMLSSTYLFRRDRRPLGTQILNLAEWLADVSQDRPGRAALTADQMMEDIEASVATKIMRPELGRAARSILLGNVL